MFDVRKPKPAPVVIIRQAALSELNGYEKYKLIRQQNTVQKVISKTADDIDERSKVDESATGVCTGFCD